MVIPSFASFFSIIIYFSKKLLIIYRNIIHGKKLISRENETNSSVASKICWYIGPNKIRINFLIPQKISFVFLYGGGGGEGICAWKDRKNNRCYSWSYLIHPVRRIAGHLIEGRRKVTGQDKQFRIRANASCSLSIVLNVVPE